MDVRLARLGMLSGGLLVLSSSCTTALSDWCADEIRARNFEAPGIAEGTHVDGTVFFDVKNHLKLKNGIYAMPIPFDWKSQPRQWDSNTGWSLVDSLELDWKWLWNRRPMFHVKREWLCLPGPVLPRRPDQPFRRSPMQHLDHGTKAPTEEVSEYSDRFAALSERDEQGNYTITLYAVARLEDHWVRLGTFAAGTGTQSRRRGALFWPMVPVTFAVDVATYPAVMLVAGCATCSCYLPH